MEKEKLKSSLFIGLRILKYILAGFLALVLQYLIVSFMLSRIGISEEDDQSKDVTIHIVRTGVHTDFVLPIQNKIIDWDSIFPTAHTRSKDSTNTIISIGWGDKDFFLNTPDWEDLTFNTAINATFGLGQSALHIIHKKTISEDSESAKILLSYLQYQHLCSYILENTEMRDNKPILITPSNPSVLRDNDAYYESIGSYGMFYTCNTFINDGLSAAGKRNALWTPFAGGIFNHYEN